MSSGTKLVRGRVAVGLSAVVPGIGQISLGKLQRGLLVLAATFSMAGIYIWQIAEIGRRADGFWPTIARAVERRPGFVIFVAVALVSVWVLNIADTSRIAANMQSNGRGGRPILFVVMIATFFVIGWQVSEIDLGRAISELPDALPPLSRVLWPWRAAIDHDEERVSAFQEFAIVPRDLVGVPQIGIDVPIPETARRGDGEPYLGASPTVGVLSIQDPETYELVAGSRFIANGFGFESGKQLDLWWEDEVGNQFRLRKDGEFVAIIPDQSGSFEIELTMPYPNLTPDMRDGFVTHRLEARQVYLGAPKASEALTLSVSRMVETIIMGMMATIFGIILSVPVSFLAARNIMSGSALTMTIYYLTRTVLNIIRSIEPLIWALIAVVWIGLGPFAGVIALTVHSVAALGKLYSEAIEGIDRGPIEAIQATGANRIQTIIYAVLPQMISPFISFSIYRWDINVRMSTVIGLVGGGGIGFILVQYIRLLDYRSAGIAVWFIAITVALLDYVSSEIRNKLA